MCASFPPPRLMFSFIAVLAVGEVGVGGVRQTLILGWLGRGSGAKEDIC